MHQLLTGIHAAIQCSVYGCFLSIMFVIYECNVFIGKAKQVLWRCPPLGLQNIFCCYLSFIKISWRVWHIKIYLNCERGARMSLSVRVVMKYITLPFQYKTFCYNLAMVVISWSNTHFHLSYIPYKDQEPTQVEQLGLQVGPISQSVTLHQLLKVLVL